MREQKEEASEEDGSNWSEEDQQNEENHKEKEVEYQFFGKKEIDEEQEQEQFQKMVAVFEKGSTNPYVKANKIHQIIKVIAENLFGQTLDQDEFEAAKEYVMWFLHHEKGEIYSRPLFSGPAFEDETENPGTTTANPYTV